MSEPGQSSDEPSSGPVEAGEISEVGEVGEPPQPLRPTRGPSEVALGAVLLAVLVGLALVGQDHWRRGLLLVGGGLLVGAAIRLLLPSRAVGLLAVRGRVFDTIVLAALGVALLVLTSSVPLPAGSG